MALAVGKEAGGLKAEGAAEFEILVSGGTGLLPFEVVEVSLLFPEGGGLGERGVL